MRSLITHLRLPFQLLLAPIFLWGVLLALLWRPTAWPATSGHIIIAFVVFHICNYGGGTAFNSFYDRDEGPIGGLAHPPPVIASLLPFSLVVQCIGWVGAALVNGAVFTVYGIMFALFIAYSHPWVRLKAHPYRALATVAFGQGVLGFWAGWLAVVADWHSLSVDLCLWGALSALLITVGLYPLSQIYQIAEDSARGDTTIAVLCGVRGSFRLATSLLIAGCGAVAIVARWQFGVGDSLVIGLAGIVMIGAIVAWQRAFASNDRYANFRASLRFNILSATAFGLYIAFHLVARP